MRLYDTYSARLAELPGRPGRSRMYVCGPTVYARGSHRQRPSVISGCGCVVARCAGYDATLVHNITDINDKIYEAAPGAERGAGRAGDPVVPRGHGRLRARPARQLPKASETIPEIVALIERAGRARAIAYAVGRRRLLPRRALRRVRRALGQRPDQVEEQEPNPLKEDPRDFALWKANKPGEDTCVGVALGARPAGLAHRVLGDGGEVARARVRDPRRRPRPRLPAPRERARAVAQRSAASSRSSGCTTGCCSFTGEKMSKSLGNVVTIREALDECGPRDAARLLPDRATGASRSTSRRRRWRRPRRGPRASARSSATRRSPAARRRVGALRGRARRRLQHARGARDHARLARPRAACAERSASSGSASLAEAEEAPARGRRRSPSARKAARAGRRLRARPTGCATRSRRPAGRCATSPRSGFRLVPAAVTPGARLRPQRRARGAARAARGARDLGDRARARGEPWLRETDGPARPRRSRSGELTSGGRDARPPGRGRLGRAVPLRRRVRARRGASGRCSSASTRSPTRTTSAPSCRSAEGAGATGVVVPAHGSARVTPAVARASAGAVEHLPVAVVPNLARYLGEIKRDDLWVWAAAGDARDADVEADLTAASRSSSAPRGAACGRSSAGPATRLSRSRSPARSTRSTSASRPASCSTRRARQRGA